MRRIPFRVSFVVLNFLRERHVLKVACVKIAAGLRIGEREAPIMIELDGRLSVPVKYPFGTEPYPFIPTALVAPKNTPPSLMQIHPPRAFKVENEDLLLSAHQGCNSIGI